MIDRMMTTTRNSVPQRWWAVGYLRTSLDVSGSPASRAWIVMCSAPWYWKTRRMSGDLRDQHAGSRGRSRPGQALDEVLDEAVLDVRAS